MSTQHDLHIVFQDEHIVVVHKPSGLLVHRSLIDKRETQFLVQQLRDQIGCYVYSVHRLDKPTSGLIVFALSSAVAKLLSFAFEQGEVSKCYHAIVRGYLHDAQVLDYPLVEDLDKMTDKLSKANPAKQAITSIKPVEHFELPFPVSRYKTSRFTWVELKPRTGRKHQLRRHMAHLRHPIIGDTTHGDGRQNRYAREHLSLNRLALVATSLSFKHPLSHEPLTLSTELDEDVKQALFILNARNISAG
ncbi:tRNA pseudouridine(65) synthase TruC [Ningiella sp. W23]|uniref:tRNA pseudouridine(65) synthase TruC n=1 Tax=Ningiella sp. W23 TaxID=3023715 RepID=UPI0037566C0F